MPVDRADLERRIAAATAEDTTRGLNFVTLFGLVRDHLGDAAVLEIDVHGKGSRVEFFSYPIAEYLRVCWNGLERLEPVFGTTDAVLTELGRRTMAGFLASMIGRTVFGLTGREPRRMLQNGPFGYRAAVSYGERAVTFQGPTAARMTFRRDFMPAAFHAATILTALQATSAVRPRVVGRDVAFLDSDYDITWE